ncbi:MAG: S49 family peptidase [Alphaproteobacteria bacterium]|nr:S49 family peptidase [Alphaproteobacteria bacterium]
MLSSVKRKCIKPAIRLLTLDFLRNPSPKVAVLHLKGVIGSAGRFRSKGLVIDELRDIIEKAFNIDAKAVAVVINSPGGSPVQSALIHDAVQHLAREKDIPIFCFAEDVCASGGYWLACMGEEIYAHRASIVGSIGVVASGFGFTNFIAQHGIERRIYTQGENKAMLDPFQPEKQEDIDRLLSVQHDVHEAFKEHVKLARGKRLNADSDELFSGAFWSGKQAMEMGLVDGLGDVDSVMREKYGDKVKLHYIKPSKSFIAGLFSSKFTANHIVSDALSTVEERGIWARFGL